MVILNFFISPFIFLLCIYQDIKFKNVQIHTFLIALLAIRRVFFYIHIKSRNRKKYDKDIFKKIIKISWMEIQIFIRTERRKRILHFLRLFSICIKTKNKVANRFASLVRILQLILLFLLRYKLNGTFVVTFYGASVKMNVLIFLLLPLFSKCCTYRNRH